MKKLFLLILSIVAITSCNSNNNNEINNADQIGKEWDKVTDQVSYDTLGYVLPYIDCIDYEYELGKDNLNDDYMVIYAYYETEKEAFEAIEEYWYILDDEKFKLEQTVATGGDPFNGYFEYDLCIGRKIFNEHDGVEIQFLSSEINGKYALGIFGFNYFGEKDVTIWPEDSIDYLFTHTTTDLKEDEYNIPKYENDDLDLKYETYFSIELDEYGDPFFMYLDIYVSGTNEDSVIEYLEIIEESNYYDIGYDEMSNLYMAMPKEEVDDLSHFIYFLFDTRYDELLISICTPIFEVTL